MAALNKLSVDIFCRVVDNYGDIGVTWRLARQLVAEYGLDVRLFVDDIASFDRISRNSKTQYQSALPSIYHWKCSPNGEFENFNYAADIVIEAFACELPDAYLSMMAEQQKKALWINLEYLTAETWVADYHLMPSPHPRLPMTKYFYFPGFDRKSGGLIREKSIRPARENSSASLAVFVFGYATPALIALIQTIALDENVPSIAVAEGALAEALPALEKIHIFPFVAQPDFDALLATHDFLIVRGEDSFVRAQYAAKPFIWHIYPQEEGAHLVKLNAFLDLYCVGMSPQLAASVCELSRWLSGAALPDTPQHYWQNVVCNITEWRAHAVTWQHHLLQQPDLATQLMNFYQKPL